MNPLEAEECLPDGGLIWGLSIKVGKIWPGGPPVPEMTLNDFNIIKNDRSTTLIWYVMKIDRFYHVNIRREIVRPKKRQLPWTQPGRHGPVHFGGIWGGLSANTSL